jgi:hypothetical protein
MHGIAGAVLGLLVQCWDCWCSAGIAGAVAGASAGAVLVLPVLLMT